MRLRMVQFNNFSEWNSNEFQWLMYLSHMQYYPRHCNRTELFPHQTTRWRTDLKNMNKVFSRSQHWNSKTIEKVREREMKSYWQTGWIAFKTFVTEWIWCSITGNYWRGVTSTHTVIGTHYQSNIRKWISTKWQSWRMEREGDIKEKKALKNGNESVLLKKLYSRKSFHSNHWDSYKELPKSIDFVHWSTGQCIRNLTFLRFYTASKKPEFNFAIKWKMNFATHIEFLPSRIHCIKKEGD